MVTNGSGKALTQLFYNVDCKIGERRDASDLYIHAHHRSESPMKLQDDFEILPEVSAKGQYRGALPEVQGDKNLYGNTWWGEGEVKVYINVDVKWPTLVGTESEDYAGTP